MLLPLRRPPISRWPRPERYDWLESDGVAYVVPPVGIGSDIDISLSFRLIPGGNSYGYVFGGYNGWSQTTPPTRYSLALYMNAIRDGISDVVVTAGQPKKDNTAYGTGLGYSVPLISGTFSQSEGVCILNGIEIPLPTETKQDVPYATGVMPMPIFCGASFSYPGYRPLKLRLYRFKVVSFSGETVFDFEPRVVDGEAVAFDRGSNTALETLGGGRFTAGKDPPHSL